MKKMKFLIPTEPDDSHALLVKAALEEIGHHVRLLFTADLPTQQKNSVFVGNHGYQWKSVDDFESVTDNEYDVVWWRRARKPHVPKESTHPDDYLFVRRENELFYESLTFNMAPDAWWVNPKASAARTNSKLLQLKLATQCGMTIPMTLCSNNPMDIRTFLTQHQSHGVIYKPLCSNSWTENHQIRIAYTSKVTDLDLPDDPLLQLAPGIYQKEIKKKYELRVTCFGDYLVAAKLNSQLHAKGQMDWRVIPPGELSVEPYQLPLDLEYKIRQFMRRMGIVFGAFDFIVTPNQDYVFLEINEQGQFLWIEDVNPEFKMLDIFVKFLLNKSPAFQWDPKHLVHKIEYYEGEITQIIRRNLQRHVDLNSFQIQHK